MDRPEGYAYVCGLGCLLHIPERSEFPKNLIKVMLESILILRRADSRNSGNLDNYQNLQNSQENESLEFTEAYRVVKDNMFWFSLVAKKAIEDKMVQMEMMKMQSQITSSSSSSAPVDLIALDPKDDIVLLPYWLTTEPKFPDLYKNYGNKDDTVSQYTDMFYPRF